MKTILVATDLSERSDRAMDRAIMLARQFGARLIVVHVVDDTLPAPMAERMKEAADSVLAEHIAPARADVDVTVKIPFGEDWVEILRTAETEGAELIIAGLHRRRGVIDFFRGTTVERILRQSNRPVLVVRNRAAKAYERVLVGVDFSIYARRAIETVLAFAPKAHTRLIHVYDVPFKGFLYGVDTRRETTDRHVRQFADFVAEEMDTFLSATEGDRERLESVLREGQVHTAITAEVESFKSDLLVLGTHGRTGVAHTFLGSVAESFLTDPPADVLAVKAW